MKKLTVIFIMVVAMGFEIQAQAQWNGVTTATGSIYRSGNVGIGPEATIPGYASLYLSNGGGLNPNLMFRNSDATVDNRVWSVMAQAGRFRILTQADNGGSVQDAFIVERSGVNVTNILFPKGFVGIGAPIPNGNLHVSGATNGKAEIRLEADTDNNNENDNPFIAFVQDGNTVGGFIGLVGDPNTAPHYPKYSMPGAVYTGTKSNALFIGTNFSENLQFGTNGAVRLTFNESGNAIFNNNVAIGTVSPPVERLHVAGNLRIQGVSGQTHSELNFYRADGAKFATIGQGNLSSPNSTFDIAQYNGNDIRFMQGTTEAMRIFANGSVGIGSTTTGTLKLAVEGKIGAREVNVLVGPWPDYVFEKNYDLRTLAEVENYINQNKHLPEVPTAKEMEKTGVNLGEMNTLLLKKVEELTLYLLDQNKTIQEQAKEIDSFKKRLEVLEQGK